MNQEYLEKIREIQSKFIELIENQYEDKTECEIFVNFIQSQGICQNLMELKLFLHMLVKIADNHHRTNGFFEKIDRIISLLKEEIQKKLTNSQIFDIFKNNKRILLNLFKEKIIQPNEEISSIITTGKYLQFFYPEYFYVEFKNFYSKEIIEKVENAQINNERLIDFISEKPDLYEKMREDGENDDLICQIIRKDSINEFISYHNQSGCLFTSNLDESIFETNSYLLEKKITMIEYAVFFGSIQIMKYLFVQSIVLAPSLWLLAIHGQNPELIHLLEENSINPNVELYQNIFFEAIKCHHNDLVDYIENNFLQTDQINENQFFSYAIDYYNFYFFNTDIEITFDIFYDFCRCGYYFFVESILKSHNFDLNTLVIQKIKKFIQFHLKLFFYKIFKVCIFNRI